MFTVGLQKNFTVLYQDEIGSVSFVFEPTGYGSPVILYAKPYQLSVLNQNEITEDWINHALEKAKEFFEARDSVVNVVH